jgi:hypothetical protein
MIGRGAICHFVILLKQLWTGMGQTVLFACQDWASTKATYQFLSMRVSEHDIHSGRFNATVARLRANPFSNF